MWPSPAPGSRLSSVARDQCQGKLGEVRQPGLDTGEERGEDMATQLEAPEIHLGNLGESVTESVAE